MFIHVSTDGRTSFTDRLVYALVGLLGGGLLIGLGSSYLDHALRVRRWPAVDCLVVASQVHIVHDQAHSETPYVFSVLYQYTWQGQAHSGTVYSADYRGSRSINEADALARRYAPGARTACLVDPRDPTEAVLLPEDPIAPLLLVGLGVMLAGLLLGLACVPNRLKVEGKKASTVVTCGTGLALLGFGGAILYLFFLDGCLRALRAQMWLPTPCQIVSSNVLSQEVHGEAHMTFYRPEIVFRYQMGGQPYRSSHYNFTEHGTPWYYGKRRIIRDFPAGLQTTCYVDPTNPSEAVLTRGASITLWGACVALAICAVGLFSLLHGMGLVRNLGSQELAGYKPVALAVVAGFATQIFLVMAFDVVADGNAGQVDWQEAAMVILAGVIALGPITAFLRSLSRRPSRSRRFPQHAAFQDVSR